MNDDEYKEYSHEVLSTVLSQRGEVHVNVTIPTPTLTLDLCFDACPLDADVRQRLGLLGRMLTQGPCLIERCYKPLSRERFQFARMKMFEYDRRRQLAAGAEEPYAADVHLWITMPRRPPEELIQGWAMKPRNDWPQGFIFCSVPILKIGWVFMDEVPETPETRILHRLTRRETRTEAFEDLDRAGLPRKVWSHKLFLPGDRLEDFFEDFDDLE